MRLIRKIAGLALGLVAFIAGCWWNGGGPAYGVFPAYGVPIPPPPPHDPTVTLDDFSYAPPSPAKPGDTLALIATTNKPTDAARITVRVGDPIQHYAELNDDGWGADDVADDGVWHGELGIRPDATPEQDLPVKVQLIWQDGAEGQELAGEDLTILEGEE